MNHSELIKIAYRWLLKSASCSFAFKDLVANTLEQPDVIGWQCANNGASILIECKTSKSDFNADLKKDFRVHEWLGVGQYRFYLAPKGVLSISDIPPKWGLLEVDDDGKTKKRIAPKGNIWRDWPKFEYNQQAEIIMLCSALRRVHQNRDLEKIFNYKLCV